MRLSSLAALCVVLAGCSSAGGVSPSTSPDRTQASAARIPQVRANYTRAYDGTPVIYAGDSANQKVWIVPQSGKNQKAIGSITGFNNPKGLAVDSNGNLYVGDVVGTGNIYVFAPGATSPFETLTGVQTPYSVAVDTSGNVYADCPFNPTCTGNAIYVFAAGSTTPTSTLVDDNLGYVNNVAVDAAGDVFLDGFTNAFPVAANEIDEFPAGSTTPVVLAAQVLNPGALAIDAQQNLIVANANGGQINVYAPPYAGAAEPTKSITHCQARGLSLNSADSSLWYTCDDRVVQLTYPGLKAVEDTAKLTRWGLYGVAADPPSPL